MAAVACAVVTLNVGGDTENAKQWALAELPPDVELLQQHARAGLLIPAFTQPDAKIAVVWAGVVPYFSERPAIDLLGKCDKVIAREPIKSVLGQVFRPGHMKWDYEYSISHFHPDVIVELWRAPEQAADILRREHYREMYLTGLKIYVRSDSDKIDWWALEKAKANPEGVEPGAGAPRSLARRSADRRDSTAQLRSPRRQSVDASVIPEILRMIGC